MEIPYSSLPPDPGHEYYLKFCYVCQEPSKPGQEHIRNYGGIVCFSCRQFFRRAHQKTKQPTFSCTFGGNCLITVKSRRRCQKCRYDRCIFSGMVSSAVLTDEEKSVRFRKFRQKKKAKQMAAGLLPSSKPDSDRSSSRKRRSTARDLSVSSNDDDFDDNEDDDDVEAPSTSKRPRSSRHSVSSSSATAKRPCPAPTARASTDNSPKLIQLPADYDDPFKPWPIQMSSKIEQIVQRYNITLSQMQSEISEELFFKLEAIQSGDTTVKISKAEILEHLMQVAKQFHHFALLHSQFTKLKKKDQRQLLARNTPLYIQLYLSFYLSTTKGTELVQYIQGTTKISDLQIDHNRRTLSQMFRSIRPIFRTGANIDRLAHLFASLSLLRVSCAKVRAVLSYIILFDFDPRMRIYESFVLEDLNILSEIMLTGCIKKYQSGFDVEKLIKTLSEMAVFGASNIDWKKKESICLRVNPDINTLVKFSRDEQGSLEYRVRQISSAAYSVIPGEEWLRDLLLFFVGVQPTTNFLDSTVRVFQARIWRILDIHPEFSGLAQSQKRAIWNRSIPMGVAFMLVKKECANRGNDQLREEFGCLNEHQFEKFFRSLFACPSKVKKMWYQKSFIGQLEAGFRKISLKTILPDQDEPKSRILMKVCAQVKRNIFPFLADPVLEKLILVLSLTHLCQDSLPTVHATYLKYLWQHISRRGSRLDSWNATKTVALYSKVIQTFGEIKKVATLLKHF